MIMFTLEASVTSMRTRKSSSRRLGLFVTIGIAATSAITRRTNGRNGTRTRITCALAKLPSPPVAGPCRWGRDEVDFAKSCDTPAPAPTCSSGAGEVSRRGDGLARRDRDDIWDGKGGDGATRSPRLRPRDEPGDGGWDDPRGTGGRRGGRDFCGALPDA